MRRALPFLAVASIALAACSDSTQPVVEMPSLAASQGAIPDQYIVVFRSDVSRVPDVAADMAREHAATPLFVYQHSIHGFAARMSAQAAARLARDPRVAYVEPDGIVQLPPEENPGLAAPGSKGKPGSGSNCTSSSESTPWGITRVGGTASGAGKTAWIIDTGIDLTHCDLNVGASRGASFVARTSSPNDDNGHGTHVAGTIAALDNAYGVVGVAAGASVVPVKVLDRRGSGTWSGVIAGIDYVAANGVAGDVANMSLGGGANASVDNAVLAASAKVKFALAAGNEGDDAKNHSPARVNGTNIYTVSAVNSSNVFASWSNYGNPPVDYAAPGVSVLSTWKGGGYNTISGTSMATPHVAGILLLGNITADGNAIGDPDGNPDPIAHR